MSESEQGTMEEDDRTVGRTLSADRPGHPDDGRARRQERKRRRTIKRVVKWIVMGVIGVGIIASLVTALMPKPAPVDLAAVARGTMQVTVNEDGKTRVKDRYVVLAPLTGNMPRLGHLPGDAIAVGDILTRVVPAASPLLDDRTRAEAQARLAAAQAARAQAQAQVQRARVAAEQAQRESDRQQPLVPRGAVSEAAAERAAYEARARAEELRSAEFGVRVAIQEVESARAALGLLSAGKAGRGGEASRPQLEIASPVSGRVLRVMRQDAGIVQAGTAIVELGDPASLEIVADVLTRDAVKIAEGAPVEIVRWGGDSALAGHVHRIEPSAFTRISALGVEEQRVNIVIALDDPRDRWGVLGDGYRVEVAIEVWKGDDVLMIPASAVFRHDEKWAVYREVAGIARLTMVEVGRRNERLVQVTDGLQEGDSIVVHPSDRVSEGAEITARVE